jgi:prolyl oligopeptidase
MSSAMCTDVQIDQFPLFTSGRAWISDYGDPEDPVDFDFMYPIAPLLNVPKARTLPPMLILTADRTSLSLLH